MIVPVIRTERLVLRAHEPGDLDDCAAMWADPRVTRHIGLDRSRQETWFTMARYRGFWSLLGYGYWIVRRASDDRFVGEVGFADFQRGLDPDISGGPEAGWALAFEAFGQGYASEAVIAMHDWLDHERAGTLAHCVIAPGNTASARVAQKAGYSFRQSVETHAQTHWLFRRRTQSLLQANPLFDTRQTR